MMVRIKEEDVPNRVVVLEQVEEELAKATDEELVVLKNATLHSFKLMTTGLGFDVHLTVALDQRDKLPALTMALHRLVDVHVVRYSRRARRDGQVYDFRAYYEGLEDDGEG